MTRYLIPIWAALFAITMCNSSFAGFGSYRHDSYKFTYEIEGEINVAPDRAVMPLMVRVHDKSFVASLSRAKEVLTGISGEVKGLGEVFSSSPSDYSAPNKSGKRVKISFLGDGEGNAQAHLVFNIHINFKGDHDFWERAGYMATLNDFIAKMQNRYRKNDIVTLMPREIYYEISNIEKYRETIVKSVYAKSNLMADIVAKSAGMELKIDQVTFNQHISREILNFSEASLSLNAKFKFAFIQPKTKSE